MEDNNNLSRRSFFKFALAGAAVVPFIIKGPEKSFAATVCPKNPPAGKPIVSPTEGMGKTLQYVTDSTKTKSPKYKAGSSCINCKFYNFQKAEGGYAPCTMMGMKYVTSCGWCTAYAAKV